MVAETVRGRILIAEDDPMVMELITTRLELAGYRTFSARNGREALDRIRHVKPDALVLDINMPVLDGFQVLAHLKSSGDLARTPTMVLTARNCPDDVRQAIHLGARDFIAKPFRDEQLIARVGRLVRRAGPAPVQTAPARNPLTTEI